MEVYGVPKKRNFKEGDKIYLLDFPNKPRIDKKHDSVKKNKYKQSLIKKLDLFYKKGMLGIIIKIDNGYYHIKFPKSMDIPEEETRPLRLPPNWKPKIKKLKRSFTYPFSHIGIYKKIRLAKKTEINRVEARIKRTKKKESSSRRRKLRQKKDEFDTPRFRKNIQDAIQILDDADQNLDRNTLQELSDEVRELDDEINQLLSEVERGPPSEGIKSPVAFLKSRNKKK